MLASRSLVMVKLEIRINCCIYFRACSCPLFLFASCSRDASGEDNVIVLDLLALQDQLRLPEALNQVLGGPFGSPSIPKLGELPTTHPVKYVFIALKSC